MLKRFIAFSLDAQPVRERGPGAGGHRILCWGGGGHIGVGMGACPSKLARVSGKAQ